MRGNWTARRPRELIVYDGTHPCPYLEGRDARLPMRLPARALQPHELDARLDEGDRRHGAFLYRPSCPACTACEAIRLPVADFALRPSHRRALRKGRAALTLEIGAPGVSEERLALYEKHKRGRGLTSGDGEPLGLEGYRGFLVERCVDAFEMRYRLDGELVGLAIVDRGEAALSAVYCCWDPAHRALGIGTYSVLEQLELARREGFRYLYLGLYIADDPHMAYKARFVPHERRIDGAWKRFGRS